MAETWYEIEWGEIKPIQVVRETASMVVLAATEYSRERRTAKHRSLFRTKEEAATALLQRRTQLVEGLRKRLADAEKSLAELTSGKG